MRSVMHSGRYTVSTESHCDRALIVKAHSQQCAMEGTTVILDVTDSNGLTLTLRETAKITPWTSLYTTQPPCLLQKKKPQTFTSLQAVIRFLSILTPRGTNQRAKLLLRQFTA